MSVLASDDNHEHNFNEQGLCPCGKYRGFIKRKNQVHIEKGVPKLVTMIQCESCNGKGKNTRGSRCLDCNGTGTRKCEE